MWDTGRLAGIPPPIGWKPPSDIALAGTLPATTSEKAAIEMRSELLNLSRFDIVSS
jgi:hypothetical protein